MLKVVAVPENIHEALFSVVQGYVGLPISPRTIAGVESHLAHLLSQYLPEVGNAWRPEIIEGEVPGTLMVDMWLNERKMSVFQMMHAIDCGIETVPSLESEIYGDCSL